MERKPLYEVILARMAAQAPKVLSAAEAEERLMDYGNMFKEGIIPSMEALTKIAKGVRETIKFLPTSSDTLSAEKYLRELALELEDLIVPIKS